MWRSTSFPVLHGISGKDLTIHYQHTFKVFQAFDIMYSVLINNRQIGVCTSILEYLQNRILEIRTPCPRVPASVILLDNATFPFENLEPVCSFPEVFESACLPGWVPILYFSNSSFPSYIISVSSLLDHSKQNVNAQSFLAS